MARVSIPGWLIFIGSTVVAVLVVSLVGALLLTNHSVPDRLYDLMLVIGVAYFGAGPFLVTHGNQANANLALIDTVNHHADVLHTAIKVSSGMGPMSTTTGLTTGSES